MQPEEKRGKHKLCYLTTIDGLESLIALHDVDPSYVPLIAVRHPACFHVALSHKRDQHADRYDHCWNEQAAVLTAVIGLGPDVFANVAAMVEAFPARGERPDYTKPGAYRDVARHVSRIRDALGAWGYQTAKVGVDFGRGGQWQEHPEVQPDADDGLAAAALCGAFGDNGKCDFVMPVWKGNRIRAMEAIAASDRRTVLIAPEYYPVRAGRRPTGTIPQLFGSPVEPDFHRGNQPWPRLYTCKEMIAFAGDAMIYFRSQQERDGFGKMADLIDAASKPTAPPMKPDPTDPDVEPEPSIDPRADDEPVIPLAAPGHGSATFAPTSVEDARQPDASGDAVVGRPPAN